MKLLSLILDFIIFIGLLAFGVDAWIAIAVVLAIWTIEYVIFWIARNY